MGLLARFFKGGLNIHSMMKMRFRQDIKPWYNIYLLQSMEEEIITELSFDKEGNRKTLPNPGKIREMVLHRIEERKKQSEGIYN